MRIQEVEVASFRGFKERCHFDFQGVDLLVLYGPNGHGKSSFFDAIEWGVSGGIHRYDESNDERKRSRFVGNRFSTEPPQVVLRLAGAGGQLVTITRTGTATRAAQTDYGASQLVLEIEGEPSLQGEVAERRLRELLVEEAWRDKVDVNRGLSLTHLLGQERMNYFLRGMSGNERYDALSLLFGTEQFYRYRETVKELQRDLESQRDVTAGRLQALEREQSESAQKIHALLELWSDLEETPAHLQEVLFEYMGLFMPIEQEMTPEGIWLLIKEHQEELLEEKVRFEFGEQRELRLAQELLSNWQQAQKGLFFERERAGQLEQFFVLRQRHKEVEWLLERVEPFERSSEQREELMEMYQDVNQRTDLLRRESSSLTQFIGMVDDSLDEAMDHGEFELIIEQIRAADVSESVRDRLLEQLALLSPLYKAEKESKKAVVSAAEIVAQLEKVYDQVVVMDQKYRNLLSSVEDYLAMTEPVEACPTCGTAGITSVHLMEHIRAEQEVMNPALPAAGESLMEAKQNWQEKHDEAQEVYRLYEEAVESTDQMLDSLEKRAEELLVESMRFQKQSQLLLEEIHGLDQFLSEFGERAAKWSLEPTGADLRQRVALLREQTVGELERVSAGFSVTELLDVEQTREEQERKVKALEAAQQEFLQHMNALGHVQAEGQEWSLEEVEALLAGTQQKQDEWLTVHEQKEAVALRVLSVLSRYERYQELEGYKQRESVLQAEREQLAVEQRRIEEDLEILKEVYKKVPEAVDRLNEKVIAELFGTIQSIFERINSHPVYRTLEFEKGQRFGTNRMLLRVLPGRGVDEESAANPSFIFSAAQVNSIALSFFLAMALQQQWSPLRLIAMDDPVQSMDDLNVLALIDLLRSMCESQDLGRQVMVSTHDRTFYQMMLKKFRFLNVGVIEYEGYGTDGPVIKQQVDPLGRRQYVQRNTPVALKELGSEFLR